MRWLALSRETSKGTEWLVTNGQNMGRWTLAFGPNCLADNDNCRDFVTNMLMHITASCRPQDSLEVSKSYKLRHFEIKEAGQ